MPLEPTADVLSVLLVVFGVCFNKEFLLKPDLNVDQHKAHRENE